MLRPEDVWQPRIGAPLGNCNRLKTGHHRRPCKELRRTIAQWRRETKALMADAKRELARRELAQRTSTPDCHPRRGSRIPVRAEGRGRRWPNKLVRGGAPEFDATSSTALPCHDL